MKGLPRPVFTLLIALCVGVGAVRAYATGTATDISGLYYTGDTTGTINAATQGGTDGNWKVTYASVGGTSYTGNSTYTGSAYVVTNSQISGSSYIQDTSNAQWITAPGASTSQSGGSTNQGGLFLPGNGTSGSNEGIYIYTLAFTISGTGSGTATNKIGMSLTIAADDNYYVYINPTGNGTQVLSTSAADASGTNAWGNTTSISLANYTDTTYGFTSNVNNFKIGTNYLVVEVVNSNEISGSTSASALNASGLLVYQVGNVGVIDGHVVPEMHTWLPMAFATLLGAFVLHRRREALKLIPVRA